VLKSSSKSGQWMPYPPPAIFQLSSCSLVACSRRGYQAKGTLIVRPSFNPTLSESAVKPTLDTRSSVRLVAIKIKPIGAVLRTVGTRRFYRIAVQLAQAYTRIVPTLLACRETSNGRRATPAIFRGRRVRVETLGPPAGFAARRIRSFGKERLDGNMYISVSARFSAAKCSGKIGRFCFWW